MNSTTVPNARGSTLKQSSFSVKANDDGPHDIINSLVTVSIYHQFNVRDSGKALTMMSYYMRWKNDRQLQNIDDQAERFAIEFKRITKLIESKLKGRYANNRMTSINVYLNLNQGGRLVGEENDALCRLVISPNYEYQALIIGEEELDEEQINFFNTEMEKWAEAIEKARK